LAIKTLQHLVSNRDGWLLSLWQSWNPERVVKGRRPVVIVPGYGMNSFIFSYHPRGLSLEGFLADAGFEVWRADLRAQGASVRTGGNFNFSLSDLALTDLGAAIDTIVERNRVGADRVDVIGASLGGTLTFIHSALNREHRMGSIVAMGSPLRWVKVHPFIKAAFSSPSLVGAIRFKGSRKLAELGLPIVAKHVPWLLTIYMNPQASDVSAAKELVKTVEDPNRFINREIAVWIGTGDLFVHGHNVSEAFRSVTSPLLCVVASHDGIVPEETARYAFEISSSSKKQVLTVGDSTLKLAHADLFIANEAHARVFQPISDWLTEQGQTISLREVP
jgi:pimeloyl-ACP methyl ester carboxylesterase